MKNESGDVETIWVEKPKIWCWVVFVILIIFVVYPYPKEYSVAVIICCRLAILTILGLLAIFICKFHTLNHLVEDIKCDRVQMNERVTTISLGVILFFDGDELFRLDREPIKKGITESNIEN